MRRNTRVRYCALRGLTYVTAETVCELLRLVAGTHLGMPVTIVKRGPQFVQLMNGYR